MKYTDFSFQISLSSLELLKETASSEAEAGKLQDEPESKELLKKLQGHN